MRFYIAGKWEEYELIGKYAAMITERGHEVTHAWYSTNVGPNISLMAASIADLRGVMDADCCVFVFERKLPYSGAMSELGAALALGKLIYVIGLGGAQNVFTHHPNITSVTSFEELLEKL